MLPSVKAFESEDERELLKTWDYEMNIFRHECSLHKYPFVLGSFILACPRCEVLGFYWPRDRIEQGKVVEKYFACKFCGAWQYIEGGNKNKYKLKLKSFIHVYCTNHQQSPSDPRQILRYDWRITEQKDNLGTCQSNDGAVVSEMESPLVCSGHLYNQIRKEIAAEVRAKFLWLDNIKRTFGLKRP